jgi:predicted transcriptional regulator
VFVALSSVPDATNRELEVLTGLRVNEITPRVKELRENGVVVQSCERRCKQSGRTVIAWKSVAPSLPPAFPAKEEVKVEQIKQTLF